MEVAEVAVLLVVLEVPVKVLVGVKVFPVEILDVVLFESTC